MDHIHAFDLEPAWIPDNAVVQASNIYGLMQDQNLDSYDDLYQWSITDRNAFWDTLVKQIGIRFRKDYHNALDESQGTEHPRWLVDAKLNIVESCFQAPDDSCVIIYQTENRPLQKLSVGQLKKMVHRVANGLTDLGLQAGDRAAIAMPMII